MEITELIERYLEGSLSESEKFEVEQKAQTDIQFRKLIDLHREVNDSIADEELHDLQTKIRQILKDNEESNPVLKKTYLFLKIAVMFLIIAGAAVAFRFISGRSAEERLYGRYYQAYETDIITRSGKASDRFSRAIEHYNNKKYQEAFEILSDLASTDPGNYVVWFFRGITSMQLKDFDQSIESFSKIPEDWDNPYHEHANWYYALALMHEQKTQQAKVLLQKISNEKGYYSDKSDAILSGLN